MFSQWSTDATIVVMAFVLYGGITYEVDKRFRALNKRVDDIITRLYNLDGHGRV